MNILMQSRVNFWKLPGGDTVQLTKTREELIKLGVNVDISLELEPNLEKYDIVHLSNLTRIQETYVQMKNAVKQKKPVVLSTIYWPMEEFELNAQIGIRKVLNKFMSLEKIERTKAILRYITDLDSRNISTKSLINNSYYKMQKEVIDNTNFFLPNSNIEMQMLQKHIGFLTSNYAIIPNGVDSDIISKIESKHIADHTFDKYNNAIICVGRLDTRKNQLSLVKALDGLNYKLILVGQVSKNHINYFKKINKIIKINKNFVYIPFIENEKIYELFKVCKVSVLPSWLDTPGLVNLEAGAMGCNLVLSTRGSTKEYFGNYVEYCEPNDLESIRVAVKRAFDKTKDDKLKKYILKKYTWRDAAEKTLQAYQIVLK